tara:strand:- start:3492 stop:4670 length:1179 start_codon:yes stop_codon:yes gene_type:complete
VVDKPSFFPLSCQAVDLLVIAGEASGDEHASQLIKNLKARNPSLQIAGLGGDELQKAGVELLFHLVDHAVVGIFEVLKNYSFFRELFDLTLEWIRKNKPKTILLVDYPGFNLRLADALKKAGLSRKGGGEIIVLQYVSPQLWAWKPRRRFKMEKVLDSLAVIFPFETECYQDVNLPVAFVGHPMLGSGKSKQLIQYDPAGPFLLLPGSRSQAIERILPVLLSSFEKLLTESPNVSALIPTSNVKMKETIRGILESHKNLKEKVEITESTNDLSARFVLMSSGTMSLRSALSGIPGLIIYKAHPFTFLLGKALVNVKYLGMANLLLPEDPPYVEFIQGRAKPRLIIVEIKNMLGKEILSRQRSLSSAKQLKNLLRVPQDRGVVEWLEDEGRLG